MYNPEKTLYKKVIVREKELSPTEKAIYEWYLKNPQQREDRKTKFNFEDMKRFSGIYSHEEINSDINKTMALRNKDTANDKHQRGEIFEAIMTSQADMNGWYDDMSISKTSEYDDYINHVDSVLHGRARGGEDVFIGVDWTISQDKNKIEEKKERIAREVKRGKLASIKYFESAEDEDDRRSLSNIPRVVIAMQDPNFQKLCEQTIGIINREAGANQNFSKSELRMYVLEEIRDQLKEQLKLAGLPGNNDKITMDKTKRKISLALEKINEITKKKLLD